MSRLILVALLLRIASITAIANVTFNGSMYKLANPSITDISSSDFAGDDCPSLPCAQFTFSSCVVAPSVPPSLLQYGWSTVFLATLSGLTPVLSWIPAYPMDTSGLVTATASTTSLTDAGWVARILLQCTIPCPGGTYLVGSQCLPCSTGAWGSNNVCLPCTNGPVGSVYTSAGSANDCAYVCPANTFASGMYSPYLLFGDGTSIKGVSPTSPLTTLYTLPAGDPGFTFMVSGTSPNLIYVGIHSISLINLTARNVTFLAGGGSVAGYTDGVGRAARFNTIGNVRQLGATQLLVVDALNCVLRVLDLTTLGVTTAVGSSTPGNADGQGAGARFRYPSDVVINADTAYVSDAGNGLIRQVTISTWTVTTLVGTGIAGAVDGVGRLAYIDPRYLALDSTNQILYVQCPGNIRKVDLATLAVTTLAPGGGLTGVLLLGATQLYFPSNVGGASFIALPSTTVVSLALPLSSWPLAILVNETSSTQKLCVACVSCAPGRFIMCNSTASLCLPCPIGSASSTGSRCLPCSSGTYASATGMSSCTACPNGSVSYGYTPCSNCSIGAYAISSVMCAACPNGTFSSSPGATACQACTGLVANATWTGPGVNATSCPLACVAGMALSGGTVCVACGVGTWSSLSQQCFPCTNAPLNATYTGVGTAAWNCPFQCNAGFVSVHASCVPCSPGTRMTANNNCTNCTAGSFSGYAAATSCSLCDSGTYSFAGSSSCTACPSNRFTVFIGRSASSSCVFYCKAGSYIANRTACVACTNGTFSSTAGATVCSACVGGTWSGFGATACGACSVI